MLCLAARTVSWHGPSVRSGHIWLHPALESSNALCDPGHLENVRAAMALAPRRTEEHWTWAADLPAKATAMERINDDDQ
jgi:hypothetical protein